MQYMSIATVYMQLVNYIIANCTVAIYDIQLTSYTNYIASYVYTQLIASYSVTIINILGKLPSITFPMYELALMPYLSKDTSGEASIIAGTIYSYAEFTGMKSHATRNSMFQSANSHSHQHSVNNDDSMYMLFTYTPITISYTFLMRSVSYGC